MGVVNTARCLGEPPREGDFSQLALDPTPAVAAEVCSRGRVAGMSLGGWLVQEPVAQSVPCPWETMLSISFQCAGIGNKRILLLCRADLASGLSAALPSYLEAAVLIQHLCSVHR